jgi:hypothetical protein
VREFATLGQGGFRGLGVAGGGGEFDWYVDSVAGNDANSGKSPSEALKTLSAVQAVIVSNQTVGLARGSIFDNERLYLAPTVTNVTIRDYGIGNKPIIDGSGIVTSWSKTGGYTNVYETTLALTADASSYAATFEDGIFMTRAASLAACDATPGSYIATNETTASLTVYIHATGSGDPTINGSEYRIAQQLAPVHVAETSDISMYNIVARRSRHYTAVVYGSQRFYADGCEIRQGLRHNATIALGGTSKLKNCIIADAYWDVATTLVAFYQTVTGLTDHIVVDGCTFSNAGGVGTNISGFNYHDSGVSVFGSLTVTGTTFDTVNVPCGPTNGNTPVFVCTNNILHDCITGITIPAGVVASVSALSGNVTTGIGILITGGTVDVTSTTLSGGSDGIQVTGGTVSLTNCTITSATRGFNLDTSVTLTGCSAVSCGKGYDVDNTTGTVSLINCADTTSTTTGLDKAGAGTLTVSGTSSFGPALFTAGTVVVTGTAIINVVFAGGSIGHSININGNPTVTLTHVTSTGLASSALASLWVQGSTPTVTVDGGVYTVSDNLNGASARSVYVVAGQGATISVQNAYIKCRNAIRVLSGGAISNVLSACDYNRYGTYAFQWDDPVAGGFSTLVNWRAGTSWDDNSTQDA